MLLKIVFSEMVGSIGANGTHISVVRNLARTQPRRISVIIKFFERGIYQQKTKRRNGAKPLLMGFVRY
jgi:hypothetical protein